MNELISPCNKCPINEHYRPGSPIHQEATETLGKLATLGVRCTSEIRERLRDPKRNPFSPIRIVGDSGEWLGPPVKERVSCGLSKAVGEALKARGLVDAPSDIDAITRGDMTILEQHPVLTEGGE
mgnify:CR=1 FL=1